MEGLSLAANILSVIDITCKVIQRINDFRNSVEGLPRSLQIISLKLPIIIDSLEKIKNNAKNGQPSDEGEEELLSPLIKSFELSIQRVSDIIEEIRLNSDSNMARVTKALASLKFDSEVDRIEKEISSFTSILSFRCNVKPIITPATAPKEPPKPQFLCPFSRDTNFVKRPILEELLAVQGQGSRYAVVGEAGIGKSQIAIEYGYRIHQNAPNTWVFWVDAENINTMEQSYRDIAIALRLPGKPNVFSLVSTWLRNESNGNWAMILDNVDDKQVLCSHPKQHASAGDSKQLIEYIPQSMNGSVLVTSRSRDAAFEVTCNYKHITVIEPMEKEEGLSLLRNYLADVHPDEDMEMLLEAVENIPLAISHAGSYITKRGMSIKSYLQEFEKESGKEVSLQEEDITQLRRNAKRGNSVVITWRITFDHIRTRMPSAARLLSLMCHFARQSIPEAILQGNYGEQPCKIAVPKQKSWWKRRFGARRKKNQQSIPMAPLAPPRTVGEDLLTLRDFSLIRKNHSTGDHSMHATVQKATKRWLDKNKELNFWSDRFIVILDDHLSKHSVTDFSTCENLFLHAAAAISEQPCETSKDPLIAWASLATKVAAYCNSKSAFEEQQILHGAAAYVYASTIGVDAPETVQCLLAEANITLYMGHSAEAEVMFRRALRIQERSLGKEHLDTLATIDHIIDTLARQSRRADADKLYEEASNTRKKVYGIKHPKTLDFFTWRGYNLAREERYAEAYQVWRQAAQARNSPRDMAWIGQLDSLGIRLEMDGQPDLAERYFRESLIEKRRIFTEDLADSDNDYVLLPKGLLKLGRNLCMQKRWCEAESLLYQSFAWYDSPRQKTNAEHIGARLESMYFLALTRMQVDKLEEAEKLCRLFLSENEGSDSRRGRYIVDWFWLSARVLERSKKCEDAMHYYEIAFKNAVEINGADHEETKKIECNYQELAARIGKQEDATLRNNTATTVDDAQLGEDAHAGD